MSVNRARIHPTLADIADVLRVTQAGAEWHDVEPSLRRLWRSAPRPVIWDDVRTDAANHWRFGGNMPRLPGVLLPPVIRGGGTLQFALTQQHDDKIFSRPPQSLT